MDIDNFTDRSKKALEAASNLAHQYQHTTLHPLHLATALLDEQDSLFKSVLQKAGEATVVDRAIRKALVRLPSQDPAPDQLSAHSSLLKVLRAATDIQKRQKDSYLSTDHLILALLEAPEVAAALKEAHMTAKVIETTLQNLRGNRRVESKTEDDNNFDALNKYAIDMIALAEAGKFDPCIGRDDEIRRVIRILSRRSKNNPVLVGPPGVGKTSIVEGLALRIISKDVPLSLQNKRIFSLDLGALIANASYKGQFEERIQSVLKEIDAANESGNGVILFIDEIHMLIGAGSSGGDSMDAANLLKPALSRGKLRCIGATTLEEYRKIEKDSALERRFQMVMVNEPSVPDTISILRGLKEKYEAHHGVRILDSALVAAATLAARYLKSRRLPDSAIDLIDESASWVRSQLDSKPEIIDQYERKRLQFEIEAAALSKEKDLSSKERLGKVQEEIARIDEELRPLKAKYESERGRLDEVRNLNMKLEELKVKLADAQRRHDISLTADLQYYAIPDVTKRLEALKKAAAAQAASQQNSNSLLTEIVGPEQINEVVARATGIPVKKLSESEVERLLHLAERLKTRIVGQDEAVKAVSDAVLRNRAGLSKPTSPYGSFLFMGSTGTGKTELAKALAAELFENKMTRIDLSEFTEAHSISKLIGAPKGYVGYGEGGLLSEAVRRNPFSVVLFDEMEKAHPQVLNLLLQILDDARLTDTLGNTVDFSNTIVILTSNVGSQYLLSDDPNAKQMALAELQRQFRPELLNRFDDIIFFNKLGPDQLKKIILIQLSDIAKRLEERHISLELSPCAVSKILKAAWSPEYGARPLRRYLEKVVVTELSKKIIRGDVKDGDEVYVDLIVKEKPHGEKAAGSSDEDESSNVAELLTFDVRKGKNLPSVKREGESMDVDEDDA